MSREGRARWAFNETFIIGTQDNPMLRRWRLIQTPLGGVYRPLTRIAGVAVE